MSSQFGLDKMAKEFAEFKRDIPPVIGVMGRKFFIDSFAKQGWDDNGVQPWQPRKDKTNTRAILVGKSGGTKQGAHIHLKQAVRDSLQSTSWEAIDYVVKGVPYAQIHNEGGEGLAFGKYPFKMPQRQFMGPSNTLIEQIMNRIKSDMAKIGFK